MMHKRLEDVTAEDLQQLVRDRAEETRQLEFKRQLDLGNDKERREAAKDVSAMANGGRGRIVYGIEEKDDGTGRKIASAVIGMTDGGLRGRLENVLASAIRPPVEHRVSRVELPGPPDGLHCLVVEVEPSAYVLHMLEAYGERSYYTRPDAAARPMGEDDVRRRYEAIERLRSRGQERVETVVREEMHDVQEDLWMSVIGIPLAGLEDSVDISALESGLVGAGPYARGGPVECWRYQLAPFDGGRERRVEYEGRLTHILRVRRDGVVHAGTATFRSEDALFPLYVAGYVLDCGRLADAVSTRSGIVGPLRLELIVRNPTPVAERIAATTYMGMSLPAKDLRIGSDLKGPIARGLPIACKAIMDRLYQTGGRATCPWIDGEGNLARQQHRALFG